MSEDDLALLVRQLRTIKFLLAGIACLMIYALLR